MLNPRRKLPANNRPRCHSVLTLAITIIQLLKSHSKDDNEEDDHDAENDKRKLGYGI